MPDTPHVHFIAIGGSVMHNLALALHQKGLAVTGSDDEINDPARARLANAGLLPAQVGWFPDKVNARTAAVVLGMHARADNPELRQAQQLGVRIYSYPEYLFTQATDQQRVVIAGSHGKTTITAIILHALRVHGRQFDYVIGARLPGFDTTVHLTDQAPLIILEGDEYLSSPLDRRAKFLHYQPHVCLISGIAWDHINVYPDFEAYVRPFEELAEGMPKSGTLVYDETDDLVSVICRKGKEDVTALGYGPHPHVLRDGVTRLLTPDGDEVPLRIFGEHNLKNISGAKLVCSKIGLDEAQFYAAIGSFAGATNRLERLGERAQSVVFKDFAHAPSKVLATTQAVKAQFPDRTLVACLELHTFSSLNPDFLGQYRNTLRAADQALVYYNPRTLAHKRLPELAIDVVRNAFNNPALRVFTDRDHLREALLSQPWASKNLLLMSSGNFNELDLAALTTDVLALA